MARDSGQGSVHTSNMSLTNKHRTAPLPRPSRATACGFGTCAAMVLALLLAMLAQGSTSLDAIDRVLNAAHAFEVLDIDHRAAVDGHSVKSAFRGISLQVHPDGSAGYRPRRARPQVAPKWTGCKPNKGVITCLYHDQSPLLSRARTRARRRSKWSTKSPHRVA